jgi:hypothetical protein
MPFGAPILAIVAFWAVVTSEPGGDTGNKIGKTAIGARGQIYP